MHSPSGTVQETTSGPSRQCPIEWVSEACLQSRKRIVQRLVLGGIQPGSGRAKKQNPGSNSKEAHSPWLAGFKRIPPFGSRSVHPRGFSPTPFVLVIQSRSLAVSIGLRNIEEEMEIRSAGESRHAGDAPLAPADP